jgi:alpha-beta hydrolase superfamily lysophospholipase
MTMTPSAEFRLTSTDGVRVACGQWNGRGSVRGVVRIAHGMGEHLGRYVGLIGWISSVLEYRKLYTGAS